MAASGKGAGPSGRAVPRRQVVTRLWRTAERQVAEIETRMGRLDDDHQALEREAKTLAIIAKTIRDLVAIDAEAAVTRHRPKGTVKAHGTKPLCEDANDEGRDEAGHAAARDLADFRAELARRLDELRRERRGDETS